MSANFFLPCSFRMQKQKRKKEMKKIVTYSQVVLTIMVIAVLNTNLFAQLSAPSVEAVYGGRINAITGIGITASSSRIFIATESANSLFYADVTNTTTTPTFANFAAFPDVNADDNYGSGISKIAAHTSGFLFFIASGNLYKVNTTASSISTISSSGQVSSLLVYGNYLLYIDGSNFVSKTLDGTGAVTATVSFAHGTAGTTSIQVSPLNNKVYVGVVSTATPALYKSSENYDALTGSSSFSAISLGSMTAGVTWNAYGIGPDGAMFFGGELSSTKYVNYSTGASDGAAWSGGTTGLSGVSNTTFSFSGSASPYIVNYTKGYSTYTDGSGFGAWAEFGNAGFETHPNDGVVFTDPTNSSIVYMTTDQGLGKTTNGGSVISEFDDGIEAVQVNDFDMASNKIWAWLASKAGIRKVSDFQTTPTWSNAMFPNFDGSPYYSAEMNNDKDDTAYVGNVRVYKTTNSGLNWTQVFTAESAPYSYSSMARVEAIEVCPANENLVTAGYFIDGTPQGGFFFSTDAGSTWNQQLLKAASGTDDADVYDIVFSNEGPNPAAYIGVNYDTAVTIANRARSVYRAEWNGSAWSVRNDFDGSYTAVGYPITATIMDLFVSGDTIFAVGTDATTNHPIAYYKNTTGTNLWTALTTSGFPTSSPGFLKYGRAGSYGADTIFVAVDNQIYYMQKAASSWTTGYTYPAGTQINVLYYDALLVGTGTGLYGQHTSGATGITDKPAIPTEYSLSQNYPNPFNPSTVISWQSAVSSYVTLKVFNVLGVEVAVLVNEKKEPGTYRVNFSGANLASGTYFYRLQAGAFVQTKKFVLLK